jgi:septal ring factor EnvC (AmiA/AmiB activator)
MERRTIARSHGFRKFVIAKMDKASVKDTHRRYLTGHAHIGEDRSYVLPTDEDLLSEYIKAIPLLTIDPTQRLENENQELKTKNDEIARLKWREGQQAQDISSLEERLNSTEESLNKIREIADGYTDLFVKSSKAYRRLISNLRTLLKKEGKWRDSLEIEFWGVPEGVSY